jgi:hypothetical protein
MIKSIPTLFIIIYILFLNEACTKESIVSPLNFKKQLLSGTGSYQNTEHVWKLDSTLIDGKFIPLTIRQLNYKKTFYYNGDYRDSDSLSGKWELIEISKLKQTIIYSTTTIYDTSNFDIILLSSAQLTLNKKLSNGQLATYYFKIYN